MGTLVRAQFTRDASGRRVYRHTRHGGEKGRVLVRLATCFFVKHYGITGLVAADVLWAVGRFSYLLRRGLRLGARNQANNDPQWFMFDLIWGDLRAILTGRARAISRAGKQS